MRIFLYEYTCGGGLVANGRANSLQAEGWAMLSALLTDFGRVGGVELSTMLDWSMPDCRRSACCLNHVHCRTVRDGEEKAVFDDLTARADFTLVIAPEFDEILHTRCQWVEALGSKSLGSAPAAVDLTGDKLLLSKFLRDRGIRTPASRRMPTEGSELDLPLVCKPRHGAGSVATFLLQRFDDLAGCAKNAQIEGWTGECIVQPFVRGFAASVSFLTGPGIRLPLPPAAQRLSQDGRFRYSGGSLPLPPGLAGRATRLADAAVDAVPGLSGFVGVDVVLSENGDESQDWVIEINPRVTTSYVGLRSLAENNLAEALLQIVAHRQAPSLRWRPGIVHFLADGTIISAPLSNA